VPDDQFVSFAHVELAGDLGFRFALGDGDVALTLGLFGEPAGSVVAERVAAFGDASFRYSDDADRYRAVLFCWSSSIRSGL